MTSKSKARPSDADRYAHIKPLPDPPKKLDGMQESRHIFTARFVIEHHFRHRSDVLINGYGYLCRNTRDRTDWTVPDCIVTFGVDPGAIEHRNGYVIDEVGKPPDFVLEVASESTGRNDYTRKREIYESLGVGEYWRFDQTGGQHHDRPIAGDLLVAGAFSPVDMQTGPAGVIRGHSPLLGLYLCWDEGRLRFFDSATEEYLPDGRETSLRAAAAEERASAAEEEARLLREELRRLRRE